MKKVKKEVVEDVDSIKAEGLVTDSLHADSVLAIAVTLFDNVLNDAEEAISTWRAGKGQEALLGREYFIKDEDEE